MELTQKLEFVIKLICIIILFGLNLAVWYNGKDLSCDKCEIHFRSDYSAYKQAFDIPMQDFNVSIKEIYDSYVNNECVVKWTESGYIYKNGIKQD